MDYLENIKQTPHGILYLDHPLKKPRVVCDSSGRPEVWCEAINDWTHKKNEPSLEFAGSFLTSLIWIWNLRIQYPLREIYVCDDDASMAFKQIKYPPNLAGLHCSVINGILFVGTAQTFGDCTSSPNWSRLLSVANSMREHYGIGMTPSPEPFHSFQKLTTKSHHNCRRGSGIRQCQSRFQEHRRPR
jgi:hypothetical protein